MILLSSPLKNDLSETTVSIFPFRNCDSHNQKIVNSKSLKKYLSSASVDDERPLETLA